MNLPQSISPDLLAQAVDQLHDGITIADARQHNWPLIYVNAGFEKLSGYSAAELIGKPVRFLQGTDTDQAEIAALREALHQGASCLVTLRNYRRDGTLFWNELSISPVRDPAGELTHFVGIQKDVTERVVQEQNLRQSNLHLHAALKQQTAPVPDISDRLHFNERLAGMLQTAQRTHSLLSVLMVNPDQFKRFNERYGRAAGDACLRMVGDRIIKSFARNSDCVTRYDNDEFAIASMGDSEEGMKQHLTKLRDQIRALNIPHSDSPEGILTICIGGITLIPQRETTAEDLLQRAYAAVHQAGQQGHDCECIVS
ncbi:MAG TPA: sensor domain-containing diguanylate cyclase [Gallionella sp.]|nr:diguanylate cyclase [Gallionella sp.]OGS66784.1 MAG: hypothetical protein A2Z87_00725 [Gallionellales bacterium GWA2_54_124]HCI53861.1 sensor domain-containing diguanylate cyclase [Gallionella sp.]